MTSKSEQFSEYKLDSTDVEILRELQKNARLTLKELAQRVNLSTTPVYERWRRLEQAGYIRQYVTLLDPEKISQTFSVYCMVRLRSLNRSVADKFVRSIASLPEVTECCSISGEYDYMLKITVPDMKTYKEFVLNQLGHLDVVGGIVSHFVMDVVKNDPELPLHC